MATIRKRTRYRATLRSNGSPVEAKSFGQEGEARAWLRIKKRELDLADDSVELTPKLREKTTYQAVVRLVGWPAQYASFSRKTDAKKWTAQTEAALREGRHFQAAEARRHSLSDLIDRYQREVLGRKSEAKRENQERHLRWWRERLGNYALAKITPSLISEYREVLSQESIPQGGLRGGATCNRYLATLQHAFSVACREWEWIERNPVAQVRKLAEPRGRVRFLSEEEQDRLLAACRDSRNPLLYPLVVLALSTGARRGELLGLRWPDIDLARHSAVLENTKNGDRRALPLHGEAHEVLTELSGVRRIDTDLIFASGRGRASYPRQAFEKAVERAGIEDFRFHDLRHSAASYLAMSGATLAEIAEILGHKTLAMVKRYSHLTEQHTSAVVARMNERFLGGGL